MQIDKKIDEEKEIFFDEIRKAVDSRYGILISHLYIEHLMDRYLRTKFPDDSGLTGKSGLGFNDKLKLVRAFGEIEPQLVDSLKQLNSIRNDCAHVFAHDISKESVKNYGRTLGKDYKKLLKEYPESQKGGIAPISYFVCGRMLRLVLEAEGYK